MSAEHPPVTQILLVRHGESREQSGHSADGMDPALSPLGERQALTLRMRLAGLRFDAVYVSPLRRAWQTFELARIDRRNAAFDSRIAEVAWFPGYYRDYCGFPPPLARPDRHVAWELPTAVRLEAFLAELCRGDHRSILVVGHQGIFRRLREAFLGYSAEREPRGFHLDNASVSMLVIERDGRRRVRGWNDNRHVARLLRRAA